MPIPDFRINTYVAPLTEAGLSQHFGQDVDQRIADYDANAEFSDVLSYQNETLLQQVAPFENDVNYARQVMNETRQNIDQWAQQGDYENMTRQVKRGARQFSQQIAPLIQNQKNYSTYLSGMEELYKSGKIGIDTYSKAKAASLSNYKGIDPNNPQQSLFSGFTPSPDINVSEKVDKFLEGWKAEGGSRIIPQGDGSYVERKWEQATEQEIGAAVDEYLSGDSDFRNYAQTQASIGNQERIISEATNAKAAGARKYGFYKEDRSMSWMPEYAFNNKQALQIAQSLPSVPSSATTNPGAVDIFTAQGLTQDQGTGKVVVSDVYEKQNGKYYKYVDSQGNPIAKEDYALTRSMTASTGSSPEKLGYKRIEVPVEEVEKHSTQANVQLVDMAANRYLKEQLEKGNISVNGYLGDEKLTKAFLDKNLPKYNNPKYLKETREQYAEAIKNSQQIYGNKRWDISLIPGASSPEFTTLKDDDILSNLTGQSVGILDSDIGGFRKGQNADLNSMLDKLQEEDGYSVKTVRRLGPLQYNPYSTQPGMAYAINLEDKDGRKKTVEIAASMQDDELQPIQNIYNLAYKGLSGTVPFHAPNSRLGSVPGQLRLRTATNIDTADGKRKFTGFVEILDAQGKKLNIPGFPQNVPIEQFGDVYKEIFAPNVLTKYLNPKYTK
jgi:hypothetical protein